MKFPSTADMETILDRTRRRRRRRPRRSLGDRILEMSLAHPEIPISNEVRRYGIALVMATHPEHELAADITRKYIRFGSSPAGAQALILGAKIRAILDQPLPRGPRGSAGGRSGRAAAQTDPELRRPGRRGADGRRYRPDHQECERAREGERVSRISESGFTSRRRGPSLQIRSLSSS